MYEIHYRFSANHSLAQKWSKTYTTASHQLFWSTNRCPCCQPAGEETAEDIKPVLEVGQHVAASHTTTLLLWTSVCHGLRRESSTFPTPSETLREQLSCLITYKGFGQVGPEDTIFTERNSGRRSVQDSKPCCYVFASFELNLLY